LSLEKLSPFQEANNYGNGQWSSAKKHPHMEKKYMEIYLQRVTPLRKGSVEELLEILEFRGLHFYE